ncbi:MAG: hypothetical protein LBG81_06635 [Coriobacteriaceae bacterium]|jgi:hypothetical protein|nr:hypothetical protein [Coriobacteriaceae bacterium]
MRTLKFLALDLRIATLREWPRGLVTFFLFVLAALALFRLPSLEGKVPFALSLGDYLVNAFAGMKEYVFDPRNPFDYPALWLLAFLLIAFFTLRHPYQDLMGSGKHIMLLSGNRFRWWAAKCAWVAITVLLYFAIGVIALLFWVSLTQGGLGLAVSSQMPGLLKFDTMLLVQPPWEILGFLFGLVSMTVAICLVQMLVTLYVKPVLGFVCTVSLLFLSAFFKNIFLLGNYLMAARSAVFIRDGLSWQAGLVVSLVLIAAVLFLGGFMFKRMDILDGGRLA